MSNKVSIQIVTWNSINYIDECLDSLSKQTFTDFSVLVIDNGSNDRTVEFVRANYPTATVLQNFKNTGYAKANNQGMRMTNSQYALVMNPDVVLEEDFLEKLVAFADQHEQGASFSGKILRMHSEVIDSHNDESGLRQSIKTDTIDSTGLQGFKSRKFINRGEGEKDSGQFDRSGEVFGASGAAVLFRRSALAEIAINHEVFDQDFFAYKEDIDLAWRLRLYGWQSWYAPQAVCYHHRGLPSAGKEMKKIIKHRRRVSRFLRELSFRNHKLMLVKNEQLVNVLLAAPWLFARECLATLYTLITEPFQLKTMLRIFRLLPKMLIKRKIIMAHAKASPAEIRAWFV